MEACEIIGPAAGGGGGEPGPPGPQGEPGPPGPQGESGAPCPNLGPCRGLDSPNLGVTVYQWYGGSGDPAVADSTIYRYRWLSGRHNKPAVDRTEYNSAVWNNRTTETYGLLPDAAACVECCEGGEGAPTFIILEGEPAPQTLAPRYVVVTLSSDGENVLSIDYHTEV